MPTQVAYPAFAPMYPYSPRFAYMGWRRRYWGGWYSPFYDPLWGPMPAYDIETEHRYHRELELSIQQASDGKRLFDVTVRNVSRQMSTPAVMPALVQSAFHDFPGPNGGARVIVRDGHCRSGRSTGSAAPRSPPQPPSPRTKIEDRVVHSSSPDSEVATPSCQITAALPLSQTSVSVVRTVAEPDVGIGACTVIACEPCTT